jgi:tetratricopeptide (TPR) repeat protein
MGVLTLALFIALNPLEQKGIKHLYNLEFQAALAVFEKLAREEPTSPAGPHYTASALWMEELTRRGAMSGETFQSSRYWTSTRKEPPSASLVERFQAQVAEAKNRSETLLESGDDDREAIYFLGATESVVSAFEATIRRSYYSAYRAGRRANKHHERLLKLDPDYADANLVPGIYQYTLATLPRSVKYFVLLIGIRGSKEKGIRLISRAAREGKRATWGATLLLTVIDTREKRYHQALTNLKKLTTTFPKNPLFQLEQGWVHLLRKDWTSAHSVFESVQTKRLTRIPHYDQVPHSLVLLRLGESRLFDARFGDALARLDEALTLSDSPDGIRAMLHLRKGQALDGLQRRREARAEYETTVRLNTDKSSRKQAKRYLKKPFSLGGKP